MENMTISVQGDVLRIEVDLRQESGFTRAGNVCIGTTGGNINLPGPDGNLRGEIVNCTVWRKTKPSERARGAISFKKPSFL
ncbi:MAG: hypothetical protein AB1646_21295 [Thermodesulfobacteriota bacterium]